MISDRTRQILSDLKQCSIDEQKEVFKVLRQQHKIHVYEEVVGAPAEMILEAVHRAPELTRRMLRGVIADAAFASFVVPSLCPKWKDTTPPGNYAYDYILEDDVSPITIQVKLQRSEKGQPVEKSGERYGFDGSVFTTETQKTRGGTDGDDNQTRPYRYGEFDVLAVSMQPSTGKWDRYMYTVGKWLIEGKKANEMATIQPVAKASNDYWTDDFNVVAAWLRADDGTKRIKIVPISANTKKRADQRELPLGL